MSARGLWLVRLSTAPAAASTTHATPASGIELVFCRRFPTVERRAAALHGEAYAPLPSDLHIASMIVTAVENKTLLPASELPASSLPLVDPPLCAIGKMWPLIILPELPFVLAILPLVDEAVPRPGLVLTTPAISTCLALAEDTLIVALSQRNRPSDVLTTELNTYLSLAAPFGMPAHVSYAQLSQLLNRKPTDGGSGPAAALAGTTPRHPAWRPSDSKARPSFEITVQEVVDASQYDNPDTPDVMVVSGSVHCKAELPVTTEVSLPLICKMAGLTIFHDHCVQEAIRGRAGHDLVVNFVPPNERVELLTYRVPSRDLKLPVRGFYQMMEESPAVVKLLLQLKGSSDLPNAYDRLKVHLPFSNRGAIVKFDAQPSMGSVAAADTKHELVWTIGRALPAATQEVSLSATVYFNPAVPHGSRDDPFCTGQNAYVSVDFVMSAGTLSGLAADIGAVKIESLPPKTKLRPAATTQLSAGQYLIWNSLGKARVCATYSL